MLFNIIESTIGMVVVVVLDDGVGVARIYSINGLVSNQIALGRIQSHCQASRNLYCFYPILFQFLYLLPLIMIMDLIIFRLVGVYIYFLW